MKSNENNPFEETEKVIETMDEESKKVFQRILANRKADWELKQKDHENQGLDKRTTKA